MANTDRPFGMRAVDNPSGTASKLRPYTVKDTTVIYEGMIVALNSTAEVIGYTTTDAVAGDLIGVAAHPITSAQTDRELMVYSEPEQLFEIQADGADITASTVYKYNFAPVTNGASGNTTTLQSIGEITSASLTSVLGDAATNIMCLQLLGVSRNIQNETGVAYTRYIVRIAPPCHLNAMSGVGIISTFAGIG